MNHYMRALLRGACLTGLILALASCDSLSLLPPRPTTTPTPLPTRALPRPTPRILTSDELYGDDRGFIGRTDPRFASLPVDGVLPPVQIGDSSREVKVVLGGGLILLGERYGFGQPRRPGLLLLARDVSVWRGFAQDAADAGLVVVALQIGNWLESRHMESLLLSMMAVDSVDTAAIAIIGESQTADLAFIGCAVNVICDAAALFSPLSSATLVNMLPAYGDRPLWLAASTADAEAHAAAAALSQAASGDTEFLVLSRGRGAALLAAQPELVDLLVQWLVSQLDD